MLHVVGVQHNDRVKDEIQGGPPSRTHLAGGTEDHCPGDSPFVSSPRGGGEGALKVRQPPHARASLMQTPKGENGHREPGQVTEVEREEEEEDRGCSRLDVLLPRVILVVPPSTLAGQRCSQGRACAVPANESEPGTLAPATDDASSLFARFHLHPLLRSFRALHPLEPDPTPGHRAHFLNKLADGFSQRPYRFHVGPMTSF